MHDLIPLTPLGGDSAQIKEIDGVIISEMPEFAYASLAMRLGKKVGFRRAAKKAIGMLPPKPGESSKINTGKGFLTVFWTGVDQWIVEAPSETHADIAVQLKNTFNDNASVTEQNDGLARFDLKGKRTVTVLERLSATDSAKMHAGSVTRTSIEHVICFLICREPSKHFSIICPQSFAAHLYQSIVTTAKSAL